MASTAKLTEAPQSTAPTYQSLQSAAIYGDMSVSTLRRLISSGELKAKRVGSRMLRIRTSDLDELLGGA